MYCTGQQQLCRPSWNFKMIFSRPLFTIIFKTKMVSNLRKNFLCIVWHQKPTVTSCQTFSISDIPFRITVIYGPLNDLSKIYRLLWVLTKTLNIHWILEGAPQTNLLYFVTSNIRFFQQKKIQKNFRHSFSKKYFMLNWSLFFT